MVENIKKIVSHLPPRHMDDFLALCILKSKYPNAKIEFEHPQNFPKEYLTDPSIILVDIGGILDVKLKKYDHHQNLDLPCSLILVIEYELKDKLLIRQPAIQFIDVMDRFGIKQALCEFRINKDDKIELMRDQILMLNINLVYDIVVDVLNELKRTCTNFNGFISMLYNKLDNSGKLYEIKKKLDIEKKELERKYEQSVRIKSRNIGFRFSNESFAPYHTKIFDKDPETEIIIERNHMNPNHTSIIRSNKSKIDLSKIFKHYKKVFLHPSGFIAVIDKDYSEISKDKMSFIKKLIE